MKLLSTAIPDVKVLQPEVFGDERGYFFEAFNRRKLAELGLTVDFVQDNQSLSRKGVLRGLHYQVQQPQGKLVRCVSGAIFDVAVDLRRSSSTFGRWFGAELTGENKQALWVPRGFAHGFLTLSDTAVVLYKADDYYAPQHERSLLWNDSELGIAWPTTNVPSLSSKDAAATRLQDAEVFA